MKNPFSWLWNRIRHGEDPRRYWRGIPSDLDGIRLNPDQMLSISAVWGCISAITNAIARCQWQIYQPLGPHKRQLLYNDPLYYTLNSRPNPEMTGMALRESLLMQAIAWGNSYAEIVPDRTGKPLYLYPLLSDRVNPRRDPNTWALVFDVIEADGTITTLPLERVFHLHGIGASGIIGENIISRAARSIAVAYAQERFAAGFFGRGASPTGILNVKGKLTDPTTALLKEDFQTKHSGLENAHRVIALEEGMTFSPIGVDPQKAQLTEEQQFSVEQLARWFGVPLHKIGHLERATFSNIEQQDLSFERDTLRPWCTRLEQEADAKLVGPRSPRQTCIDTHPLTQGDAVSRAAYYSSGRQNGWLTANEIRAQEGKDNVGSDGDVLLVNGTLKPLADAINPPAPPPPPALPPGDDGSDDDAEGDSEDESNDDDATEPDSKAKAVAREAVFALVGGAVARHARAVKNRRRDLLGKGKTPEQVEQHLSAERPKALERFKAELAPAAAFAELAGIDLSKVDLENGLAAAVYASPDALARDESSASQGKPDRRSLPSGSGNQAP